MGQPTIGILPVLVAQVVLQLLLALILAGILGAFHRLYRQAYLRHWSLAWLALVVYVGASAGVRLSEGGSPHLLLVAAWLVAGYFHAAWLLLGAWGLARGADVPRRTVRLVLGTAAAAGLVSVLPAMTGRAAPSAIGIRCLVTGLVYLVAAFAILARRRPLARVGSTLAGLALLLYAADQLAYFGLGFSPASTQVFRLPFLMTFDLLATAVLGLALVAWLLEGEREKQVPSSARTASPRPPARSGTSRRSSARSTRAWARCSPRGTST
jgi:hypothetical protein